MSIRGGQIIHQAGEFVLHRAQSAGPGDLNIPEEKIYELGNYESIATVRDIPEIQWELESYDTSCTFEALLINKDPSSFPTTVGQNEIDFRNAVPIDITSPWKSRRGQFDVIRGVSMPYLTVENASYRFGVGENATQSFTLRGDSIFYTPGAPIFEVHQNIGDTTYNLQTPNAIVYKQGGNDIYVLSVCLVDSVTNAYKRLFFDPSGQTGYTNTSTSFTLAEDLSGDYDTIHITYGTDDLISYTQTGNNTSGNPVHVDNSVIPAAVRGKDIVIRIAPTGASAVFETLTSIQSFELTWGVTLENDEELGNERYVTTDYDVPEVNGSISMRPFDTADLWDKLSKFTGVNASEVIGPNLTVPVQLEAQIKHPDTGAVLKTFYVPDARFTVPGYNAQVQTKQDFTVNYSSDSGVALIYNGARTA